MTEQNKKDIYKKYIINPYLQCKELQMPSMDDWDYDIISDAIHEELQRRSGFIYIFANSNKELFKVGMTRVGVDGRLKSLNSAGVVEHWYCLRSFEVKDVFVERLIQKKLLEINPYHIKEIFFLPLNLIEHIIEEEINQFHQFLEKL
jgi:hypothetical protein